jgi:ABC-type Fe3+/spermidine/putrescine transport system ATPase subunit
MSEGRFEFHSVTKKYGEQAALDALSFTLQPGQHTALLGASGCGKSTALRLLCGLEAPSAGEVLLDGQVISAPEAILLPPHRRGLSMVFQDLALWPNLTVLGNVLLGLSSAGLGRSERHARAVEALSLCGTSELARRKPGQLSGGQQQRVALARAIAARPRFLLLDEPFTSLDLVTKSGLLREIAFLASSQRLTVVLVTHDPLEAIDLCRFALVLESGRLIQAGELEEVLREPRSSLLEIFRSHVRGLRHEHKE